MEEMETGAVVVNSGAVEVNSGAAVVEAGLAMAWCRRTTAGKEKSAGQVHALFNEAAATCSAEPAL